MTVGPNIANRTEELLEDNSIMKMRYLVPIVDYPLILVGLMDCSTLFLKIQEVPLITTKDPQIAIVYS